MMKSTIYVKCPNCSEKGLLQELQGKYLCANCNFDYTSLKDQSQKLDEVLLSNLREGPWGQIAALELHRRVTLIPDKESIEYVKRLAESNGIKLPEGKKCFVATACYGDNNSYEVITLKMFRDSYLVHTFTGRIFTSLYYVFSPSVAAIIEKSDRSKYFVKKFVLQPLIKSIVRKCLNDNKL